MRGKAIKSVQKSAQNLFFRLFLLENRVRMKFFNKMWDYLYENCRDLPIYLNIATIVIAIIAMICSKGKS